ncbi:MAG TPA: SDR family oxidoreductase [Bacillaceae bacterium]
MKKYALITGSTGGIGEAAARQLASEGWNLYLHYNKNECKAASLFKELSDTGIEVIPIKADLERADGPEELTKGVYQLDAIVYASGTASYGLFTDMDDDSMARMIQLHVASPLKLARDLIPRLLRNPSSQIVLVSSIWGQTGAACEVLYSAVKGAQISFAKALGKEMAGTGLRVNCVAPGAVATPMMSAFTEGEISDLEAGIPMGRLARPKEIADSISFLLSDKSSYVTGQVLSVNGGWYT